MRVIYNMKYSLSEKEKKMLSKEWINRIKNVFLL